MAVRCDMPEAEGAVAEDEDEDEDDILQLLLMQYGNWECDEGWGPKVHHSAVLLIDTMVF